MREEAQAGSARKGPGPGHPPGGAGVSPVFPLPSPAPCQSRSSPFVASHRIPRALGASVSVPAEWDDSGRERAAGRLSVNTSVGGRPGQCESPSHPSTECSRPAHPGPSPRIRQLGRAEPDSGRQKKRGPSSQGGAPVAGSGLPEAQPHLPWCPRVVLDSRKGHPSPELGRGRGRVAQAGPRDRPTPHQAACSRFPRCEQAVGFLLL